MLARWLKPLCHFCHLLVSIVPSFIFWKVLSVFLTANALFELMHTKNEVFSSEVCNLGRTLGPQVPQTTDTLLHKMPFFMLQNHTFLKCQSSFVDEPSFLPLDHLAAKSCFVSVGFFFLSPRLFLAPVSLDLHIAEWRVSLRSHS